MSRYYNEPRDKPDVVNECCSCPPSQQIPIQGFVGVKLEMGAPVSIKKFWCGFCGMFFKIRDQDKYFPSPSPWTETKPLHPENQEPVEDE